MVTTCAVLPVPKRSSARLNSRSRMMILPPCRAFTSSGPWEPTRRIKGASTVVTVGGKMRYVFCPSSTTCRTVHTVLNQSPALSAPSEPLALLDRCLRTHLPTRDEAVTRRFIQLVTGIFEQRSLLLETIAESSVFTAADSSNVTQVRRILRDARITLE